MLRFLIFAALAPLCLAGFNYSFNLRKGMNMDPTNFNDKYYIPDGSCSGVINSSMFPPNCPTPVAMEVTVRDNQWIYFNMEDNLKSVTIYRKKDFFTQSCKGRASVSVKLACPIV